LSGVVVTGLGTLGAAGVGREALAGLLASGLPRTREVDRSAGYHRRGGSRRAALAGELDFAALVPPALGRRMSAPSRFAVAAARLALADARLSEDDPGFDATAVVMATAFGPASFTEQLLDAILHRGPQEASPALFTESVASAAASQVALFCRALGPNLTVTQREAGPLLALGEGALLVRRGQARRALVGAVEEMTPLLHAILDRFRALARPEASGRELPRPFGRRRDGFLAAEGAAVAVLEAEEDALERGATPLCRVAASWSAFDPTASAIDWGAGAEELGSALRQGLLRAGRGPAAVGQIVSGASGAVSGDRLEARTLRAAWGSEPLPAVLVPKGATGEYGGGFLGAALLAAAGTPLALPAGAGEPDPDLGIEPRASPEPPARATLATSLAAGGAAAWTLLERIEAPAR
jgi:3-oxoacyl-[acyl-carrier-protein] synthase II